MPAPIRITHIIVRMGTGGAEKSLFRLLRHTRDEMQHNVICFGAPTAIGRDIEALGVKVAWLDELSLGPLVFWRAWQLLKTEPPQILQGWMYYGNVLASFFGSRLGPRYPALKVVWNIRQSPADFSHEKWTTRAAMRLAGRPSLAPDHVIYNSYAGQQAHELLGYNKYPNEVIPNGIDLQEFVPDESVRREVRCTHQIGGLPWVGMVCRFHPLKGVDDFLAAVRLLLDRGVNARFVLAGTDMRASNVVLSKLLQQHRLCADEVDLIGELADTQKFLPALDLLVLASRREGTPNILLEAMACGVRTVATKVGDAQRIVQQPELLVEPGNPAALADCMQAALAQPDDTARPDAERAFLQANYAIERCMTDYRNCYAQLSDAAS